MKTQSLETYVPVQAKQNASCKVWWWFASDDKEQGPFLKTFAVPTLELSSPPGLESCCYFLPWMSEAHHHLPFCCFSFTVEGR